MPDNLDCMRCTWRGLEAWRCKGGALDFVVVRLGGQLACLRRDGEDLNPLWQPHWEAALPGHGGADLFGDGPESDLLPGIVGSFPCVDRFGAPWPDEVKPVHGESTAALWEGSQVGADCFAQRAEVPSGLVLTRRYRVEGDALHVEMNVRHLGAGERDVEWAEHLTLGDPFLDGCSVRAGASKAWAHAHEVETPTRHGDDPLAERAPADVLTPPTASADDCGDVYAAAIDEGWVEATNEALAHRLRVEWDPSVFNWMTIWTEHRGRTHKPWNGAERALGLEFTTKPFPEGRPPPERFPEFAGRSTRCTIPSGEGLTTAATFTWTRI